jgi:hypothetical protein
LQAEGLSSLPVNDLGGIIARIAATRLATGQQQQAATEPQQQQQQLAAAAAASVEASTAEGDASRLPHIVQEAMPQAWKALASAAGKMVEMFRPVAFIENKETDTQVGLAVQLQKDSLFRCDFMVSVCLQQSQRCTKKLVAYSFCGLPSVALVTKRQKASSSLPVWLAGWLRVSCLTCWHPCLSAVHLAVCCSGVGVHV